MQVLNFPQYELKLKQEGLRKMVWDIVRRKWVVLTAEEWVRQHLIHFLNNEKKVPLGLISVEKKLVVNGMNKRTDVVIYKGNLPRMLCECKAPDTSFTQSAMDQAAIYNLTLQVPLLLITNGMQHYCAQVDYQKKLCEPISYIPSYDMM